MYEMGIPRGRDNAVPYRVVPCTEFTERPVPVYALVSFLILVGINFFARTLSFSTISVENSVHLGLAR